MADSVVKLTRELIERLTKDQRTIKFFEQLQGSVVDAIPISLAALFLRVDQASAIADDALAMSQQAIAKPDQQDTLFDIPVIQYENNPPLNDVPVFRQYDEPLPHIPLIPTDTRKFDAISSSYGSRWVGAATGLTVNTSEVDLTAAIGAGVRTDIGNTLPFSYVGGGTNAFFVSMEYVDAFFFDIVLCVSGVAPSTASQSQTITFYLRRVDGTLITSIDYVLGHGASTTFTSKTIISPTFVFAGGADPYQVQGFRISAAAVTAGWSLTDKILFLKR